MSGPTLTEHGDDEVDASVRAELLEHRGQPVALVGADGGEHVDHVVARVAAGAEHLARAGDDLDPAPQARQARGDRRRGFDRDLERRRVVRTRLHVEHDRGAVSASGLRPGGS